MSQLTRFDYYRSLVAMLIPGVLFAVFLVVLKISYGQLWVAEFSQWPAELWIIALGGSIATIGGIADWRLHRQSGIRIGSKEARAEFHALSLGGLPLFVLMITASVIDNPLILLIPVIIVVLYTVVLICYDEFVFHRRRCEAYETCLHRMLVLGNGVAWLAWAHLCFVRGGMIHAVN